MPTADRADERSRERGFLFRRHAEDSIKRVGELEKEADKEMEKLAKMETDDISSTMMAIEKADLTFQLMMQVRNKIISAYEELMRMQV